MSIYASTKRLAKNRTFMFFVVGLAFSYPPIMVLITFIADTFLDSGFTLNDANVGLLVLNACSIFGRLLPGILMQTSYIKAMLVPALASILTAVSMSGLITGPVSGSEAHVCVPGSDFIWNVCVVLQRDGCVHCWWGPAGKCHWICLHCKWNS